MLFKKNPRRRVLFVSWTARNARPFVDPSVRYRCFNMCQELTRRGYQAEVVSQSMFEKSSATFGEHDLYVFHRPYLNQFLAEFLAENSERCVADFDDFIFDVRYADQTPSVRVRGQSSNATRKYVACTAEAASMFPRFTTSTTPLKEHCDRLFSGESAVVHNAVDRGYLGLGRALRKEFPMEDRPYSIGYFSGTATHDLDLKMVAGALAGYLSANPRARMLIVGPVQLPEELAVVRNQIILHGLVPYHRLPSLKAQCQRVIGPLEDTIFTRSKSGLKFFEAALVGCDVLATPIPDIDRFDSPVLWKCASNDEWADALMAPFVTDRGGREEAIRIVEDQVRIETAFDGWREFAGIE